MSNIALISLFFMASHGAPQDLHSFPTRRSSDLPAAGPARAGQLPARLPEGAGVRRREGRQPARGDRKSTRLNSSHQIISYAVFCLKKKQKKAGLVGRLDSSVVLFLLGTPFFAVY